MQPLRLFGGRYSLKMAVRVNMHIDTRVIEDADIKSEFKFDL